MKKKILMLFIGIFLIGLGVGALNAISDERTITQDYDFGDDVFLTQNDSDNGTHVYTEMLINGEPDMRIAESIPFEKGRLTQEEINTRLNSDWDALLDIQLANQQRALDEKVDLNYQPSRDVKINVG